MRLSGLGVFYSEAEGAAGFGQEISSTAQPKAAFAQVTADAGLHRPEHAALRQAVLARYGKTLDLAEIG